MPGEHITQEQADEFAIGSLEPALERAIALHLAECEACRDIVRDSERLAATFAMTTPIKRSPSRLRGRVFTAAGIRKPGPLRRVYGYARTAAGVAAVFVAVAAFTGMVWVRHEVNSLRQENADLQAQFDQTLSQKVELAAITNQLADQKQAAADLELQARGDQDLLVALLSNQTKVADVVSPDEKSNSIGRLVWDGDQKRIWFVASSLPQRPPGETYQIWANSGGKYYSLGTFQPDKDGFARYQTVVPEGITSYDSAVVTIERAGGSPVREGPTVFFVWDLSRLKD
ncbi:MAG: anti-sigma factor [Dehalococcoidia bacterium]|jgi:anti-sigma-K factor RskA